MHMSYYFSGTVYDFLFSGVNVVTTWGMVSLCMGLASLSLLSEGFKVARSLLLKVATSSRDTSCNRYNKSERLPLLPPASLTDLELQRLVYCRRVKFHVLQTVLHIIHLTIGYILMLAVMSYNGYFTLAVVGGAGLGYYCFALFDLPSKVLGSVTSQPAKWPGGSSLPHLSEDISLKQAAEDVSECSATTQLTRQLTAVLENGAEKEEKSCELRDDCEKQPIAETHKVA
ncbi:high affinity copper uptake protein 1-like isoform X3 [Portunus trituberculatus]|uniref:high affinity copper uptake protein 1-like isoform X3 n=1 Tax=Portunus trituberculatus TaxID=210409 RepID=UPI001E1CCA9A|nr:high affinity copper uptake protein 1-like isoform X3 [Portunus trituberculatus]